MSAELAKFERLFADAAAASAVAQQARRVVMDSLQLDGKLEWVSNGDTLVDPMDVLRRMQDVKLVVDRAVAAMTSIQWPTGAHFQAFADLRSELARGRKVKA